MSGPALLAVDADVATGSVVWWGVHGDVPYARLRTEWLAAGLDPAQLPREPTRMQALSRALGAFAGRAAIVRPVDGEVHADGTPVEGYALLTRSKDAQGKAQFTTAWDATFPHGALDPAALPILATPAGDEPDESIVEVCLSTYRRELGQLAHGDLSSWLVSLVRANAGIALRESGGVYFLPRAGVPLYRAALAAVARAGGGRGHEVPVQRSDEAVAAILASLLREAAEEESALKGALQEDLGAKALEGRAARAAKMEAKLAGYEVLLGVSAANMRVRLYDLRTQLGTAALRAAE